MACKCIEVFNEKLIPRNTRIKEPILLARRDDLSPDKARRVYIETEAIATGRGKLKPCAVFSNHCPFCGVSQGSDEGEPEVELEFAWPKMEGALATPENTRVTVRMPAILHKRIQALADRSGTSVNAYCIMAFTDALNN